MFYLNHCLGVLVSCRNPLFYPRSHHQTWVAIKQIQKTIGEELEYMNSTLEYRIKGPRCSKMLTKLDSVGDFLVRYCFLFTFFALLTYPPLQHYLSSSHIGFAKSSVLAEGILAFA
jgi:hypothetical protein